MEVAAKGDLVAGAKVDGEWNKEELRFSHIFITCLTAFQNTVKCWMHNTSYFTHMVHDAPYFVGCIAERIFFQNVFSRLPICQKGKKA